MSTTTPSCAAAAQSGLEYPACPLCRSEERALVRELTDEHRLARCTECGLHYLYPRVPEEAMHRIYQDPSYYQGGEAGYSDTSYLDQEAALRATFRRLLENLQQRGLTGGDLLEVGCGYGYLLDEARPYFRRRVGTDYSPEAAARARESGAEVFAGGVERLGEDAMFDCAVAIQVIEHIYDPVRFLRRLVAHVRPGGHVVLATPDIGGNLHRLMGGSWPSFKVPEHVAYFDFASLSRLMNAAGVTCVRRLPYPHAFPFGLLTGKFGLPLPKALGRINIWVPATTVAADGQVSHD